MTELNAPEVTDARPKIRRDAASAAKTTRLTISLDEEVDRRLRVYCAETRRPMSRVIEEGLSTWLTSR